MKKIIPILLFVFLFTACAPSKVPVVAATSTSPAPATEVPPTAIPTSTVEPVTATDTPTEAVTDQQFSSVDGMPQMLIPEGVLHMGGYDVRRAPNEVPDHDVTIDAFWMDQLEVTNAMFHLCVEAGACPPPQSLKSQRRTSYFNDPEFNDYPVVYVTWGQARAYCQWAGRRLPTEAEWERAGRGDDFRTFPWGEDKANGTLVNFNMLVGDTSRVGSYPAGASPFGVLDMAGNVAEWVNDFYGFNYSLTTVLDPAGPETSATFNRVVRGGSLGDAEINIRVSKRSSVVGSNLNAIPGSSAYLGQFSPRIGFRCAADEN